jgi:hypothetical protein
MWHINKNPGKQNQVRNTNQILQANLIDLKKMKQKYDNIFLEIENIAKKLGLYINQGKTKYMIVEQKKTGSTQNTIGQLTIKNYTFESFKHLGVILNEDNNY